MATQKCVCFAYVDKIYLLENYLIESSHLTEYLAHSFEILA